MNTLELVKALSITMEYRTPQQHQLIVQAASEYAVLSDMLKRMFDDGKKK